MPQRIVVLGSTGSVGQTALRAGRGLRAEQAQAAGHACNSSGETIAHQTRQHAFPRLSAPDPLVAPGLTGIRRAGVESGADDGADRLAPSRGTFLAAIGVATGLPAILEAPRRGLRLSNRESLAACGAPLDVARQVDVDAVPVASERSALSQATRTRTCRELRRLEERIAFPRVVDTAARALEAHDARSHGRDDVSPQLEEVLEAVRWAREEAIRWT